jgi:hypothetical protein
MIEWFILDDSKQIIVFFNRLPDLQAKIQSSIVQHLQKATYKFVV